MRSYWAVVASFAALGVCIAFAQPMYSVPDEDMHWAAGHARLERTLGAEGCVPTVPPYEDFHRWGPNPPLPSIPAARTVCRKEWGVYGDVLTYPGLVLSKLLLPRQTESATRQIQAVMLTRLLQGLIVVVCMLRLGVLASRAKRGGVLLAGAFCLSPLLAQQAFAVSSDGAQLGFAVGMLSAILYWELLGWPDLFLFLVLGWGATAKPFVLTCVLPSVLIGCWYAQLRANEYLAPRDALIGISGLLRLRRRPSVQSLIMWSAFLLSALTVFFALRGLQVDRNVTALGGPIPGVDPKAQLSALLAKPRLLWDLVDTMTPDPRLAANYVGPLGWLDTPVSRAVVNRFSQLFLLALLVELVLLGGSWARSSAVGLSRRMARAGRASVPLLIGLVGPAANVFFVTAVLYTLWTPVGSPSVLGVQTRYFFGSTIVLLGALVGALDLVCSGSTGPVEGELKPASWRGRVSMQVLSVAGPTVFLGLTLPYIVRVFIDLSRRYG